MLRDRAEDVSRSVSAWDQNQRRAASHRFEVELRSGHLEDTHGFSFPAPAREPMLVGSLGAVATPASRHRTLRLLATSADRTLSIVCWRRVLRLHPPQVSPWVCRSRVGSKNRSPKPSAN